MSKPRRRPVHFLGGAFPGGAAAGFFCSGFLTAKPIYQAPTPNIIRPTRTTIMVVTTSGCVRTTFCALGVNAGSRNS